MPRPRKLSKSDPLEGLPAWAQKLAQRYYTRTVSTFVVFGAVRDLQPVSEEDGSAGFGNLRTFLADELFGGRDHVVFYDRSSRHPRRGSPRPSRISAGRSPATTRCTAPTSPR